MSARSDDWKGEHLIRSPYRSTPAAASEATASEARHGFCRRCGTRLARGNTSGMCRRHNHQPGCECSQCARQKTNPSRKD